MKLERARLQEDFYLNVCALLHTRSRLLNITLYFYYHTQPRSSPFFFLQYFQKDMPASFEADAEGVINLAFSIKINQKKMKKLEKEYTTMKTKEKEDEIELRVCVELFFYKIPRG